MRSLHGLRIRPLLALALLLGGAALGGCYNPFAPRIAPVLGTSKPAPVPSSASGVLRLFEWCYNNQAIAEYREIFTDDYQFFFSPLDSAGAEWRGTPWTREDELISVTQLFVGGSATEPAASSIRLTLDRNFFIYPDPNYTYFPPPNNTTPRDPTGRWHKNVRTTVTLLIGTDDGNSIEITGHANFYMVRGDSAVIPEELRLRGFGPDSNRWYIRRWDDETAQSQSPGFAAAPIRSAGRLAGRDAGPAVSGRVAGSATAQPQTVASWGAVKAHYLRRTAAGASMRAPPR